ncbi:hypothetical protein M8C21_021591 [Ambrosia artemisiifolia]|uniref:Uncharacterized protein n=1 Tax=Ambrosia artemisiifolia TaxID=4212 RepID=A0AAD5G790_AMBAR|nr:hypothetical protein M8C21_021591 [Ambrosia artemisiifolia]
MNYINRTQNIKTLNSSHPIHPQHNLFVLSLSQQQHIHCSSSNQFNQISFSFHLMDTIQDDIRALHLDSSAEDSNLVPNENGGEPEESVVRENVEEELRDESHADSHMEGGADSQAVHSEPKDVAEVMEQVTSAPEPVEEEVEKNKKRHLNVVFIGHVGGLIFSK